MRTGPLPMPGEAPWPVRMMLDASLDAMGLPPDDNAGDDDDGDRPGAAGDDMEEAIADGDETDGAV